MAGAGLMGHGIAQVHAAIGKDVALYEPDLARAEAGRDRIAGNLDRAVAKGRLTTEERDATLARIDRDRRPRRRRATRTSSSRPCSRTSGSSARLWRELDARRAAARDLRLEHELDRDPPPGRGGRRAERRARFLGMHFFSPVPVMPLIELIRGQATSEDDDRGRSAALAGRARQAGHRRRPTGPGFIVNRILMPFLAEAMRALEQGLGTAEDIDAGARVGLNHPMGPLELADFIGLDVCLGIMRVLEDGLGLEHMRAAADPRATSSQAGHLGQKTGQGFYTYPREPRS